MDGWMASQAAVRGMGMGGGDRGEEVMTRGGEMIEQQLRWFVSLLRHVVGVR